MSDPAVAAQRQQQRQQGLIAGLVTLPFRFFGVLCGALLIHAPPPWKNASFSHRTIVGLARRSMEHSFSITPSVQRFQRSRSAPPSSCHHQSPRPCV